MHNMRGKEDADFLYACTFIHLNRMNWTDAVLRKGQLRKRVQFRSDQLTTYVDQLTCRSIIVGSFVLGDVGGGLDD